ncbi:methyltransferase [Streptomyces sp. YIM 98790]|uniref:class I SAM-dependent methyltransferase n=1 Tax=Streptomyces sp. YIM 98790 TaxID=2689077 RepID=UPI0028BDDB91|nr:methyltransferase [Streptomyces sp. YIM 98790]
MHRADAEKHYEVLAESYDELWVYSEDYVPWMSGQIASALGLTAGDRIADIGCGTGLFAREVAKAVRPDPDILCIDPSAAMLEHVDTSVPGLRTLRASAEELVRGEVKLPPSHRPLDAVWLKEAVHHFEDPAATLTGLTGLLAPQGRLLVVMLPATIAYPLFPAALRRYEELQPDPARLAEALSSAGLAVELSHVEHELRIERERYFAMVRSRYMSVLSTFGDAELEEGLDWMRTAHPEEVLVFPDRFAFILARRNGDAG